MYSFSYLEPVCGSMSSSICCFLTCIYLTQDNYCQAFVVICRHIQSSKICELWSTASQLKSNKATLCLIISISYCKEVSYFQSIYWCFTHICGTSWMISMFKIVPKYSDEVFSSVARAGWLRRERKCELDKFLSSILLTVSSILMNQKYYTFR